MGKVTYNPRPNGRDGFAEMAVSPQIAALVLEVAEKAKGIAEGLSADFVVSGEYEKSFVASVQVQTLPGDRGGRAHKAAVATLLNTADYAVQVEYGVHGTAAAPSQSAHKVLKRTLIALETS